MVKAVQVQPGQKISLPEGMVITVDRKTSDFQNTILYYTNEGKEERFLSLNTFSLQTLEEKIITFLSEATLEEIKAIPNVGEVTAKKIQRLKPLTWEGLQKIIPQQIDDLIDHFS